MPVRKDKFLRPLLCVSRDDIIRYLKEKKITWREDATNIDEKFLRNRIRRRLVPLLNEAFPFWEKGLAAMAKTQVFASDFIRAEAKRLINWERRSGSLVTGSENFFSQPLIIREEALFQGIDLLLAGSSSISVKRSSARRFCEGSYKAVDLGSLRVRLENEKITLNSACDNSGETGFSLLIKETGFYNLNRIGIEVLPYSTEREGAKQGFAHFYACLPLVFRQSFNDDFLVSKGKKIVRGELGKNLISAVDILGTAAFIGKAEVLFERDFAFETFNETVYSVRLRYN